MSTSCVLATSTSCLPPASTTFGFSYEPDQIGSESLAKLFCTGALVMNLMNCHASLTCLEPEVIISGCPPLQPGAGPPDVPDGVCMIVTPSLVTLLCLGSFAPASWNVQFRFIAMRPCAKALSTSASSADVDAGSASPWSSRLFMNCSACTPPSWLNSGLPDGSRNLPPKAPRNCA